MGHVFTLWTQRQTARELWKLLDVNALAFCSGKKIPKGPRGHIKAQPYDSYAFAVSRAASTGAMAGRQLTSTERVMGLIPSDAASIYGGQYRTVMLISSGYREHFGGPHVPDREFWKERGGDEWRRVLRQARNPVVLGDRPVHVWDIRGWKNPEHDTTIRDHIVTGT